MAFNMEMGRKLMEGHKPTVEEVMKMLGQRERVLLGMQSMKTIMQVVKRYPLKDLK
jgi:hypothetical protein